MCRHYKTWNRLRFFRFLAGLTNITKTQKDANKQDFEIKLNLTCQFNQQNNRDLNQGIFHLWSKFGGPSLNRWWVIVRTSSKWGKFWLWSYIWPWRSRSITPKTIGILTKVFYTYGTNLVILARTGPELSRGQASHWHTDSHTHTDTQTHTDAGDDKTQRSILASDKNGLRNYHNAKISNWVNMGIFNELRCWFFKVSKVLPQWMCITNKRSINETFFYSLCKPCLLHEHS